jgi:hypothetical protein
MIMAFMCGHAAREGKHQNNGQSPYKPHIRTPTPVFVGVEMTDRRL